MVFIFIVEKYASVLGLLTARVTLTRGMEGGGDGAATVCLMKIWVVSVFDKLKTVSHLVQSTRI